MIITDFIFMQTAQQWRRCDNSDKDDDNENKLIMTTAVISKQTQGRVRKTAHMLLFFFLSPSHSC